MNKRIIGGSKKKRLLKKDKKNQPLITIITVVLNNRKFLQKTIDSVLNQSYKNYEFIVIDGKSTDGTVNILQKSRGSIIVILNSDDIFYKNALKIAVKYFNQNKFIDFLFGSVKKYKLLYGYKPWKIKWSFGFYSTHSIGFFIKKNSQKKVGFYNTKYKYSSDYDFFYRMIVKYKLIGMATKKNEIFGKFRRGGISSKISFKDYLNETIKIRLDNGQNILLVSIIFLLKYTRHLINKII